MSTHANCWVHSLVGLQTACICLCMYVIKTKMYRLPGFSMAVTTFALAHGGFLLLCLVACLFSCNTGERWGARRRRRGCRRNRSIALATMAWDRVRSGSICIRIRHTFSKATHLLTPLTPNMHFRRTVGVCVATVARCYTFIAVAHANAVLEFIRHQRVRWLRGAVHRGIP